MQRERRSTMTSALQTEDLVTLPQEERERLHRQRSRTRVEIGPGTLLGTKYALLGELGRGGVGAVYAAENTWTGRRVAVKVLRVEYTCGPRTISRFRHEAQVASRLRHPNIVDVIDMGFDEPNNAPYIVEELLEGEGYDAVLAQSPGRRVSPEDALRVMLPVMDALAACHAAGVVHRDVKPSNIFLCRTPRGEVVPKLIDFGVSKWPRERRHVTVAGVDGQELVAALDLEGFEVSSGAACSSGRAEPSESLLRMYPGEGWRAAGALRVTLGPEVDDGAVERACAAIPAVIARVRS
jgi:serine/threonine protein kinase